MVLIASYGHYPEMSHSAQPENLPEHPCFRIPALAVFSPQASHPFRVVAAFDIRPDFHDLPGPISLGVRVSDDFGQSWSPLHILKQSAPGWGFGDASLISTFDGEVIALFVASRGKNFWEDTDSPGDWRILSARTHDGVDWTFADITQQIWGKHTGLVFVASGNGIQLRESECAGRLVQPLVVRARHSTETIATVAISDDSGHHWRVAAGSTGPTGRLRTGIAGGDEAKVTELPGGNLLLSSRSYPRRLWALSTDGAESFQPAWEDLPDPGCNAGLMTCGETIILTSLLPPQLVSGSDPSNETEPENVPLGTALDPSAGRSWGKQDWNARENLVWRRGLLESKNGSSTRIRWSAPEVIDAGPAAYSVCATLGDRIAVMWETGQQSGGSRSPYGSIAFTTLE